MKSGNQATLRRSAVLDTNVASLAIKGKASGFEELLADRDLVVSFVTMGELVVWAETRKWGSRKRDGMLNWLGQVAVLDSSVEISYAWAQLSARGTPTGPPAVAERHLDRGYLHGRECSVGVAIQLG
jgi:predicted nucleic acid-binding protein